MGEFSGDNFVTMAGGALPWGRKSQGLGKTRPWLAPMTEDRSQPPGKERSVLIPAGRAGGEIDVNLLDLLVFLQAVDAQLAADAGHLVAPRGLR